MRQWVFSCRSRPMGKIDTAAKARPAEALLRIGNEEQGDSLFCSEMIFDCR